MGTELETLPPGRNNLKRRVLLRCPCLSGPLGAVEAVAEDTFNAQVVSG
jgi:hypothetical protein